MLRKIKLPSKLKLCILSRLKKNDKIEFGDTSYCAVRYDHSVMSDSLQPQRL